MKAYKVKHLVVGNHDQHDDVYMIVEESRIKKIQKEAPKDIEIVDYSTATIIPGMIDCHVHLGMNPSKMEAERHPASITIETIKNAQKHLRTGVTFVRDVGGEEGVDLVVRDAINRGEVVGCQYHAAGRVITMTGGHGWQFGGRQCDGVDEVRKGAREQLRSGVDLVKVMATGGVLTPGVEPGSPQLTMEEMKAACDEAHKAGCKVATHAQGNTGIKNAIEAGVDSVEHGIFLDDEAIQMMIDRGVYLVPTLAAPYWIVEKGVENGIPEYAVAKSKRIIEDHINSFKKAHKAGVKIAMGTDAGTPFNQHDCSAFELKLMVEHGMTPMEAIVASTSSAADLLNIATNYGTLEAGKFADFVVYESNPSENIDCIMEPIAVYKLGKHVTI